MASDKWKGKSVEMFVCFSLHISVLIICQQYMTNAADAHYVFTSNDILQILDDSSFVGFNIDQKEDLESVFLSVQSAFIQESEVMVGYSDFTQLEQLTTTDLQSTGANTPDSSLVVFQTRKKDRSCLSTSTIGKPKPSMHVYSGSVHVESVIDFINQNCQMFRTKLGYVTTEGLHRQEILNTLFHVKQVSEISMGKLFSDNKHFCTTDSCSNQIDEGALSESEESSSKQHSRSTQENHVKLPTCEKIPYPSQQDFFHNYLKISKPVIFTGAIENWSARKKWSNKFLREKYGDRYVHIKLTPSGEYEGIDKADQFENFDTFHIPADVKQQLLFPDLVVVRPATANMKLSQFLDIVEQVSNGTRTDFSAYLEYSSLGDIVPELEYDVEEMPFFKSMLELKHLNVWLSDGNTLGKLHFDPFDNFLCQFVMRNLLPEIAHIAPSVQISGRKEVILFEPHDNTKLYEAHIPEAMLGYDQTSKTFHKKDLVDSTSMVMSPVDIRKPDFKRFPGLADAYPLNCTIDEGEVLYMPSFWWHEVQSYPNTEHGRNLAVNFWYDPFLMKEFPCQECKLDINPNYRHLL